MDLQLALPSSNNLNPIYALASPRPQQYSLSYPIIKYIFTNPSSGKAWKKLIKTCKYFFSKNSIYPVKRLKCDLINECYAAGEKFDPMKNIAKLWIYDNIDVFSETPTVLSSSLIQKIEKCELRSLHICDQSLTFDEYQFLTSSGSLKHLTLCRCTISHSDGTLVTFDRLFEKLLQLKFFEMDFAENSSSMFKKDNFKKLAAILPFLKEFSYFSLSCLTEAFDFASITDFLLKNENLVIFLSYGAYLSSGYKEVIEKFIDKIIETPPKRAPYIYFPELEGSVYYNDYRKLLSLQK